MALLVGIDPFGAAVGIVFVASSLEHVSVIRNQTVVNMSETCSSSGRKAALCIVGAIAGLPAGILFSVTMRRLPPSHWLTAWFGKGSFHRWELAFPLQSSNHQPRSRGSWATVQH